MLTSPTMLTRACAAAASLALAAAVAPSGIYFMRVPGVVANQGFPSTFTPDMLLNVTRTIGGVANPNLQVCARAFWGLCGL